MAKSITVIDIAPHHHPLLVVEQWEVGPLGHYWPVYRDFYGRHHRARYHFDTRRKDEFRERR